MVLMLKIQKLITKNEKYNFIIICLFLFILKKIIQKFLFNFIKFFINEIHKIKRVNIYKEIVHQIQYFLLKFTSCTFTQVFEINTTIVYLM